MCSILGIFEIAAGVDLRALRQQALSQSERLAIVDVSSGAQPLRIKAMGVKMVLSGEGSDEIFGGYLSIHKAPSARAFHDETVRKIDALHLYDCNRANKAMAAWEWRRECRSSTWNSSIWRCRWTPSTSAFARA